MPPDAVYVGRPSQWGNPFRHRADGTPTPRAQAVDLYRRAIVFWQQAPWWPDWLAPLRGKTLVCWCPLDQPCHADVLAELVA